MSTIEQIREKVGPLPAGYTLASTGIGTYANRNGGSHEKPTLILTRTYTKKDHKNREETETDSHMMDVHSRGTGIFFYGRETHCFRFKTGEPYRPEWINYEGQTIKDTIAVAQQIAKKLSAEDFGMVCRPEQ